MTIATETGMRRANTVRRVPAARGAGTFADIPQTRSAVEFAAAQRHSRLVRFLKLARYSPALATIGRVIAAERRALLACMDKFWKFKNMICIHLQISKF